MDVLQKTDFSELNTPSSVIHAMGRCFSWMVMIGFADAAFFVEKSQLGAALLQWAEGSERQNLVSQFGAVGQWDVSRTLDLSVNVCPFENSKCVSRCFKAIVGMYVKDYESMINMIGFACLSTASSNSSHGTSSLMIVRLPVDALRCIFFWSLLTLSAQSQYAHTTDHLFRNPRSSRHEFSACRSHGFQ
jgi:hypothetical protein